MRYYRTFDFTETIEQAQKILNNYRKNATPYARKAHPGTITPWTPSDGKGGARFVVWTYYKR